MSPEEATDFIMAATRPLTYREVLQLMQQLYAAGKLKGMPGT